MVSNVSINKKNGIERESEFRQRNKKFCLPIFSPLVIMRLIHAKKKEKKKTSFLPVPAAGVILFLFSVVDGFPLVIQPTTTTINNNNNKSHQFILCAIKKKEQIKSRGGKKITITVKCCLALFTCQNKSMTPGLNQKLRVVLLHLQPDVLLGMRDHLGQHHQEWISLSFLGVDDQI